jgi:hypothetical protein
MSKWEGCLDRIRQLKINAIALQETCVNWGHNDTMKRFKDIIFKRTTGAHLSISTIPTKYTNPYLPGGTLTMTVGKWRSFIENSIMDDDGMGRWSGTTYRVHNNRQLHMMSAYRVCASRAQVDISLSTYNQQYVALQVKGIINTDPRQQIIDDLIIKIKSLLRNNNDYIILGIDANANIHADKRGLQKLCEACNLIDMYTTLHDEEDDAFPTHINGSKRIDYILCSPNILQHVEKVGYITFHNALD